MGEQLNFSFIPSLEHLALIRTPISLWNQDDIRALMTKLCFPLLGIERQEKWQKIEDKVLEKVQQLPLPERLKEEVLCFVKPIGLQILKWMEYHVENCYLDIDLPNNLCWTPQGTVDKKKTAEILINDETIDIIKRHKLACIYCLENDIPALWNKIPENCRRSFYNEEDLRGVKQLELVVLWTYDMKEEFSGMGNLIEKRWRKCTPYQFAFEYAAIGGNIVAAEYFLQKLTPKERKESLEESSRYVLNKGCDGDFTDVFCFLHSQMDKEQQFKVFKRRPYQVLKCFLDWPWQSFFMEMVNRIWDFLPKEDYNFLLIVIVDKVINDYKDCNYQRLFGEFWQQSPISHKEYVINKCARGLLLSKLFKVHDKKNISLILKDATLAEKEKIIIFHGGSACEEKDTRSKFFQLLDNLIHKDDKRRDMEEGNSGPAKRLCSLTSEQLNS